MRIGFIVGILALTAMVFFSAAQSFAKTDGTEALSLVERLNAQIASDRAVFDDETSSQNAKISDLQNSVDELSGQRDELAAQLANLNDVSSENTALASENAELSETISTVKAELAQTQAANIETDAQLQAISEEMEASAVTVQALQAQNDELQASLVTSSAQNAERATSTNSEYETQITSLQTAIDEKTTALASADERIAELSQSAETSAQLQSDLDQIQAQLATSIVDLETRDAEIAELKASKELPSVTPASVCQEKLDTLVAEGGIEFEQGTTTLAASSIPTLENMAVAAISCAQLNLLLEIEGHTHSDGGEASNLLLSNGRAMAVYSFLADQGVPSSAMRAVGFGASDPIADNATAEGRALNQRIAFDWEQN